MIIDNNSEFRNFINKEIKSLNIKDHNFIIAGGYISYLYRKFYFQEVNKYEGDVDVYCNREFELNNMSGMRVNFINKEGNERFEFINEFDINSIMIGFDNKTNTVFYNDYFKDYTKSKEIKIIRKGRGLVRSIIRAWVKSYRKEGSYLEFSKDLELLSKENSSYPIKGVKKKWDIFKEKNDCFKESFNYIVKKI